MVLNERDNRQDQAVEIAKQMLVAARTAPKGKGCDIIEAALVEGCDLEAISKELLVMADETGMKFLLRDSANILQGQCMIIIGTKSQVQGLNCGHCGFPTCADKPEEVPCEINSVDVGIALGAAVSKAADLRVDTRIMFSAGLAAQRLKLLGEDVKQVYAIPISISSKNPFFDRK